MKLQGKYRSLLIILAIFILAAGVLLILHFRNKSDDTPDETEKGALDYQREMMVVNIDGKQYLPKEGLTSYLFIGIDKQGKMADNMGEAVNDGLCDFLLLAIFNEKAKTYSLIHINRDTMTEVRMLTANGIPAGTTYQQIALAHAYGNGMENSCENVVHCVSELLYGVPIQRYIAMTMTAIGILNDKVGGISVTIPYDMTVVHKDWTEGKKVTLKGDDALLFVRARRTLGADLGTNAVRMERQRTYLSALMQAITAKNDANLFFKLYNSTADYILTNCTTNEISDLSGTLKDYTYTGITAPEGTSKIGLHDWNEFTVDEKSLRELVISTFYEPAD